MSIDCPASCFTRARQRSEDNPKDWEKLRRDLPNTQHAPYSFQSQSSTTDTSPQSPDSSTAIIVFRIAPTPREHHADTASEATVRLIHGLHSGLSDTRFAVEDWPSRRDPLDKIIDLRRSATSTAVQSAHTTKLSATNLHFAISPVTSSMIGSGQIE